MYRVVEAMMSHRPDRAPLGIEAALADIDTGKGRVCGPSAAEALRRIVPGEEVQFRMMRNPC